MPDKRFVSGAPAGPVLRCPAMRRALLIMGKAPEPGRTKTRLVPPLSPEAAARLSHGFLLDSVHLGLALGWERVSVIHPHDAARTLKTMLPDDVDLFEQHGRGLQNALTSAFTAHFSLGDERVVLISSDNPTLPARVLEEACAALDAHDLVLGPSADGGYYLVGMRQPHIGVFEAIEWSTERVYAQTRERASQLGLTLAAVAEWYDVDEPADLDHLLLDLAALPTAVAPNTRAALARMDIPTPGGEAIQAGGGTSTVGD